MAKSLFGLLHRDPSGGILRSPVVGWTCLLVGAFVACSQAGLDTPGKAAASTGDLGLDPGANAADICGNGLDDNENGQSDEGCVCTPGEEQPCYAGPPGKAGVGICSHGTQKCIETDEGEVGTVGKWGACKGWVPPLTELCADGEDSDCDGNEDCPQCETEGECPPPDLGSGSGSGGPGSGSGDWNSGSGDWNTGGGGPGSGSGDFNSGGGPSSGSGDNDTTSGGLSTSAGSGDNNTSSGSGDNNTSSGSGDNNTSSSSGGGGDECICKPGTVRWCDTPIACLWGKQTCTPDGTWGTCLETASRPPGCEQENFYDPGCCLLAPNACCQNPFTDASMGECAQQLDCD